jgi:2-keto-4-pentenoate hydratase/2-oxohepta-3-ene-1,7-dioic acid hydratase in catechol pathway
MSERQRVGSRRFARAQVSGRAAWLELEGGAAHELEGAPWLGSERTGARVESVDEEGRGLALLAPASPSKIVCIGRNYHAHARELGNEVPKEPLLFMKAPSSLVGPGGAVELPPARLAERVDHEAELAVVVGHRLRRATPAEARAAVFGATAACDVTARDLQKRDGQWTRAKGMDTFCPLGPVLVTGLPLEDLAVRCRVDGKLRQDGRTSAMIFSIGEVLAYISETITLEPGDLVLTGTPEGVGPLADGNQLEVEIEGVGTLSVRVQASGHG